MSLELPAKPNLEYLRKQAKELLAQLQQGDAAAIARFRSLGSFTTPANVKLADAQHLIAHEYGFASWPKLKERVESLARVIPPGEMLTAAIRAQDAEKAARVIADHPQLAAGLNEPLAKYGDGIHALLAAVQHSDRATIDVLLQAGADINARSRHWSGGMGVLDECSPELAAFLIERGAAVDALAAARLGMFDRLRELVAADSGVASAPGAYGQTPLHCASTVELADYLLDHGAPIDARDLRHESTPAQHMLRVVQARHYPHDRQAIARRLVERGCATDILMAAALGDRALAERHLDADPAAIRMSVTEAWFPKSDPRSDGTVYIAIFGPRKTPHLAARDFGHEEVFQFLMDRSPEDVKLSQACELGEPELFGALLAKHPHLAESLTPDDRRRLPDAAQSNNTAAVRLMLAAGWPVDEPGEYDLSALSWASWHGNAEMVREILRYHPTVEQVDGTHHITALGSSLHGSENSWHRDTGDYGATVEALLAAGATAPEVTEDLEASDAAREVLRRHEEGSK